MDIFQFALKMEKDQADYYRHLMTRMRHEGLVKILSLLINEEIKHTHVLNDIRSQQTDRKWQDLDLFQEVKTIFQTIRDNKHDLAIDDSGVKLYQKALKLEKKSCQFYLDKANKIKEEAVRDILIRLAGEEKKHEFLIENLIDFIRRPETWLENAEWNRLDDY